MKQIVTVLIIIAFVQFSNAQISSYNISEYKLPDTERRTLDLAFDFGGANRYSKNLGSYYSQYTTEITDHNLNNNLELNKYSFKNSRALQTESQLYLNMNHTFNKNKLNNPYGDTDIKSSTFLPSVYYSHTYRRYFNNDFFEIDFNTSLLYYSHNKNEESNNATEESKNRQQRLFASIPIKYGQGRIEEVQDARQAIYILDELAKINKVDKEVSENDITSFANLISTLKQESFFDYRIHTIEELTSVDSFLRENNIVTNADISYFTTLNDLWHYGRKQIRKSGLRGSIVLYPAYGLFKLKLEKESVQSGDVSLNENSKTESDFTTISINTGFELNYEKPLSLSKQIGTDFSALFGWLHGSVKDENQKLRIPSLQLNLEQRFGLYPSTRTSFDFYFGTGLIKTLEPGNNNDNIFGVESVTVNAKTGIEFNYYISPQFRLNFDWNINYTWRDKELELADFNPYQMFNAQALYPSITFTDDYSGSYIATDDLLNTFQLRLVYSFY